MTDQSDDPLAKLFVEKKEADLQLLADTILPFVRIFLEGDSAEIRLTPAGNKLTARAKLLVYLLGRKAAALRNYVQSEAASPSEIENDTGIPGGTIRPTLKRLSDEYLVRSGKEGNSGYFVPNSKLHDVSQILNAKVAGS